ncbi:hypothetical protein MEPL4_7c01070 [Melissococcus plutonius]|uniref:Permease n=1 Tax=Melissococcus plutonius (strain ATCC 35311 / DSM 29964 / CIP 104052 / LMG 20360 / NCIMB 702443) TaxID=940190 RepID=F3YCT8_MELPT|nr:DUF979 domain-containing protein [Melissococcus plutonius]AIM26044.1 hypothetical protein MEPL_178p000660 [Melissococcus plutonius S1]KMT23511.1 hypothetical protein MEPL2_5c00200 [Melissococcus plutonius]KMT28145.1 hypothetical protein MEPL4_7c01070 [Melissococcus plutonius]KMT29881.1 hypothetical protein MEPL7_7c00570 [Melissococcus plutonius]KMT33913.1 hypothetical protein MEPL10_11c00100 [Melissococcus plutonius]
MDKFIPTILEFFYILIGLLSILTSFRVFFDKTNSARIGTSLFWLLLGIIFAAGNFMPYAISGILLTIIGILTLFKQVKIGKLAELSEKDGEKSAKRIGNWVFFPSILLAALAVGISYTSLGGQVGIGIASILSLIVAMFIMRAKPKTMLDDTDRMLQSVGTTGILPQLLAALGVIFNTAGVGDVISHAVSGVVPEGNRLAGVIAYCLGMIIFTMVMGNGFAAFTVITAGIGIPFVISQGGDPVISGTLAMSAGFSGTLLTPMAANFNALPVALLEMKDSNGVIKAQAPIALIMIVVHIALMYFLAF